jgi:hypothetical protein
LAKTTAKGSRRRYTGATFGGTTVAARLEDKRELQKTKLAAEQKLFIETRKINKLIKHRMDFAILLENRRQARIKISQPARGDQIRTALSIAIEEAQARQSNDPITN